jgi:hypothetical protein
MSTELIWCELYGGLQKATPSANKINYGNCEKCGNGPHSARSYLEITALYEYERVVFGV